MEGLRKVVGHFNEVRKFLGSLRTKNQGWEMVGFAQHAWRRFLVK